mmetsp:Transcript_41757/g.111907  ORF Transcript_41757/g.111907 Transcript_41757/m.111907 type:complete len:208 (+) Transcript_41757:404-1027(+)
MDSAASTAPPPGTTSLDSSTRLITHMASCSARSISSREYSLAPRSRIDPALWLAQPSMTNISLSPTRCSNTFSAVPSSDGSKTSSPSMPASERRTWPPVALAILRMSSFLTRRTAIALASTKYLRHMSSMPRVVRITLAPDFRMSSMRSFIMSSSRSRMAWSLEGSLTNTWTPMLIFSFRRSKSKSASLAPVTVVGIAWDALVLFNA